MAGGEGTTFGKYYLLKKIAAGGMGEIYLAKLKGPVGFEKLLVIKRILAHHLENQEFVDMFFAEARVAAQLSHSNIVQIYEMGEIEDCYFIAMEYVHGKPLRAVIDKAREVKAAIEPAHAIEIIGKLCAGMSYAHNATDMVGDDIGIIHRDINPHNLLVSYAGDVKIIDFGIAKSEMSMHKTETGTIKGKFVYMSPEQSAAEKLDKRSDLFAIGICLYETLAFFNPFAKANIVLSLDAIQRHDPEPLASIRPELAPFDPIITKALAKKPDDRYADCSNFRDDLQSLLTSNAIPQPSRPLSHFMRELFQEQIEEEKRMIVETDQASTTQIEAMRLATRSDHSSGSYRRAVRAEPGAVVEGTTNIATAQMPQSGAHQQAAEFVAEEIEPRSRLPFFLLLTSVVLATLVGVAAVVRLSGPRARTAGDAVVEVVEEPLAESHDSQKDEASAAEAQKDNEPDDSAVAADGRKKAGDGAKRAGGRSRSDDPRHSTRLSGKEQRAGGTETKQQEKSAYEPPPPPPPPTAKPQPKPAPRQQPKPAPTRAAAKPNFGTIYVSISPPVKILHGDSAAGQTLKLSSSVGALTIGSGRDPAKDPFKIKVRYRVTGGSIMYVVDAEPWAIVRGKGGIGLGRTPLAPTAGEGSTVFELQNPKEQRKQRLTLRYAPP